MSVDDVAAIDVDSAIRVRVTPSQASYFAGEELSVAITFTNTRTPESPRTKNTHRRGAHSISSAPLARPPTSAGNPRPSAATTTTARTPSSGTDDAPARKGLIGQDCSGKAALDAPAGVLEQRRQSLLAKSRSLSVEIPAHQLPQSADAETKDASSQYVRAYSEFAASSSRSPTLPAPSPSHSPSSPLPRTPDFQLPPNHPHARKQSVLDGQMQPSEVPAPPPLPSLPSSSTSSFSVALDPIAEAPATPHPSSPLPDSPTPNDLPNRPRSKQDSQSLLRLAQPSRKLAQPGLGHGQPPRLATSTTSRGAVLPYLNTELILYSYAQLLGTVSISPLPGIPVSPEHTKELAGLRLRLLKRPTLGGGSMDITSSQRVQDRRRSHGRTSSLSGGLFSLLSPSTQSLPSSPQPSSWASGYPRTPSTRSASTGQPNASAKGVGLGLITGGAEVLDSETPLPTFEVQPAMLAVDLSLAPGESRTYTYSITLPLNLPPTFRGRSLKFSYEFVVGTCRASTSTMRSSSSLGPAGANSISRVMKVPIRMYNHVAVGKEQGPYDLLWPLARQRMSPECAPRVMDGPSKDVHGTGRKFPPSSRSADELRDYGQRLLGTCSDGKDDGILEPMESADFEREIEPDCGALTGCREAVEILTRNPKKISYDVNKDGVPVAVLTFPKSAYRLGETVLGVVELNERRNRYRVLSLTAMLEAQEVLPGSIASAGGTQHIRRVHAEHHSSFVASTLRTTFSLDIPSDASPAFQIQISEDPNTAGGLAWRVRLCLLVGTASEGSQADEEGVRMKHLVQDGPAGEWGTPFRASTSIAPMERPRSETEGAKPQPSTWTQFLVSSFLGTGEREYHDGDEEDEEREGTRREDSWRVAKVETVECEVPIKVWPGNTAFKAMDVVFDV